MDFFSRYLSYTEDTESPRIYHRWCALSSVGALLSRNLYITQGHFKVFPNLYCMLMGDPAARKSTAIKLARRLISAAGYSSFAVDKCSKEQFLINLSGNSSTLATPKKVGTVGGKYDDTTYLNLFGDTGEAGNPKEVFITADEFNDFAGTGNSEFYTTLSNLWDWDKQEPFSQTFRSSQVEIFQPTISLLGGNTQEGFTRAFPPDILGHGFLSRLILIHGSRTDRRIAFPRVPSAEDTEFLVKYLSAIRQQFVKPVELTINPEARTVLEIIYTDSPEINDIRFIGYNNRRFTNLLKLCVIISGSELNSELTPEVVIKANTILTAAELVMPQALGEFGKGKNSDVSNKIMRILDEATAPIDISSIWTQVHKDLNKIADLGDIMTGLQQAGKAQHVSSRGWLPKRGVKKAIKYVDWSMLTQEERAGLG